MNDDDLHKALGEMKSDWSPDQQNLNQMMQHGREQSLRIKRRRKGAAITCAILFIAGLSVFMHNPSVQMESDDHLYSELAQVMWDVEDLSDLSDLEVARELEL